MKRYGKQTQDVEHVGVALAQQERFHWARDYGDMQQISVLLPLDQLHRLPMPLPIAEHVRRALDLYLREVA